MSQRPPNSVSLAPGVIECSDGARVVVPPQVLRACPRLQAGAVASAHTSLEVRDAIQAVQRAHTHSGSPGHGVMEVPAGVVEVLAGVGMDHLLDRLPCSPGLPLVPLDRFLRSDGEEGRPLLISIAGVVYDVTRYRKTHPGGAVIAKAAGNDGTACFVRHHGMRPGSKVWDRLRELAVGRLSPEDAGSLPGLLRRGDPGFPRAAAVMDRLDELFPASPFG